MRDALIEGARRWNYIVVRNEKSITVCNLEDYSIF